MDAGIAGDPDVVPHRERDACVRQRQRDRRPPRHRLRQEQRRQQDDDRRIEEQHEPLERRGDVLQPQEVEQARQVIADESEADAAATSRAARCVARAACAPAHHAIDDEKRRRVQHPQRQQRHRIDRRASVRELDQDRLEREAEHAEHRAAAVPAPRAQSHRTTAAPRGEQDQQRRRRSDTTRTARSRGG